MITDKNTTSDILAIVRSDVEHHLDIFYQQQTQRAYAIDKSYGELWDTIRNVTSLGGKRLRPYMSALTYEAYSNREYKDILSVMAAQEILHVSLLIHDDIIDRDYIRHGHANVAGAYLQKYKPILSDVNERRHYANSAALLSGDLGISSAYQLVLSSQLTADQITIAQKIIGEAIFMVYGGELLDTESSFREIADIDPLKTALLKTASYSFVSPFSMGASLAQAPKDELILLKQLGEALGVAYQLTDDLIGLFGDEAITGKSNISDLQEGRRSYTIIQALTNSTGSDHQVLRSLLGKSDLTTKEATTAKAIIEQSGAKSDTEMMIVKYGDKARSITSQLAISDTYRRHFLDLIDRSIKRAQ